MAELSQTSPARLMLQVMLPSWRRFRPARVVPGCNLVVIIGEPETIMEQPLIAVDCTKEVLRLHWVGQETGCMERSVMLRMST
ncbi:hypothetical protein [Variovorax sp. tm]|uniref:hypothetical protein n=1 Tax=Variovorax TaxID=34072 RepID=UPI003A7FFEAE